MKTAQRKTDIPSDQNAKNKDHLNFLGYPPCFMKQLFRDHLDGVLNAAMEADGSCLRGLVSPYCSNDVENVYSDIWNVPDIDMFPDAVASDGFDNLFRKEFIERLVRKGYFKSAWTAPVNETFKNAGLEDPDGWYTIYAVSPFVLLVDKKKLDGLPAPRRWRDLFKPQYQDKIIIGGAEGNPSDVPLLYYFKEHGEEGLRQLAANVRTIWHAARITRTAGTSNPEGAAIYIQSWFFAKCCPRTDCVSIVWPDDGACTSPCYLLVKESKMNELAEIIKFMTGPELGRQCALSYFPSLNPHVDNDLPPDAAFKWLGWDYIKTHDIVEMRKHVKAVFLSELNRTGRRERK